MACLARLHARKLHRVAGIGRLREVASSLSQPIRAAAARVRGGCQILNVRAPPVAPVPISADAPLYRLGELCMDLRLLGSESAYNDGTMPVCDYLTGDWQ